ncbi:hypothetical protein [Pseudomonas frederiksbergensis]|uniref:Uncharacterized protein n=1 Tax=Pseudomonas frederiksbergensis TaxID=104087 RepID=A0A423K2E3_9PSED|nr:hypothetical protein [Pseudomonas frederiksbergensis]RON45086.1 hypothetical protein BK666_16885 [Pseudomonas frederiksbergensis]RON53470.1 hypothetical protein BK667_14405 [Pseudomonas frederiksbergensis]
MKKSRPQSQQSSPSQSQLITEATCKIARILIHLSTGASLNRFEAEDLGDHCLNTTISALANRYGLFIQRNYELAPNHWGKPCRVKRYSLPFSEREKARKVLAYLKLIARSTTEG